MYVLCSEHDLNITFGEHALRDSAYQAAVSESQGCTFGIVIIENTDPVTFRKIARLGKLYDYIPCWDCYNGRIDGFICGLCEGHGRVESNTHDIT